ncbi:MAG: hypothetical protein OER88_12480, partial [Planctomycetota bacterium]|nr:hypothetical protein [Planctomycetota bacterium]
MLDRGYSFVEPDLLATLREKTVPVALDVWYESRRRDAPGEFFRKIVYQRPELQPGRTQQGFYVCSADGTLYEGWNNRSQRRMHQRLSSALEKHAAHKQAATEIAAGDGDRKYARTPPAGGLVVEVASKITSGEWPEFESEVRAVRRDSVGRDHLWVTAGEVAALVRGDWPKTLGRRIARFHLIDNTGGEAPMWKAAEVRAATFRLDASGNGARVLTGAATMSTRDGSRGYEAALRGEIEVAGGSVTRFDVVARGAHWGHGDFVHGSPAGRFTLVVAFRLARRAHARFIPPQGARDLKP